MKELKVWFLWKIRKKKREEAMNWRKKRDNELKLKDKDQFLSFYDFEEENWNISEIQWVKKQDETVEWLWMKEFLL